MIFITNKGNFSFLPITRWVIKIFSRHNKNAGDFSDAASEWEMALKCGSLPRDAGDSVRLPHSLQYQYGL